MHFLNQNNKVVHYNTPLHTADNDTLTLSKSKLVWVLYSYYVVFYLFIHLFLLFNIS